MKDIKQENLPAVAKDFSVSDSGALIPASFDGLWRLSRIIAASGLAPKGLSKPESVFVATQMGMEVGLSPMAAIQNIAVINNRPSIWGDAVLALVRGSGLLEDIKEWTEGDKDDMIAFCRVKRAGQESEIVCKFSVQDAKRARLWGKDGPWRQYPERMLQMRARGFALRDGFSDVLRGIGIAEEVMDMQAEKEAAQETTMAVISDLNEAVDAAADEKKKPDGGDNPWARGKWIRLKSASFARYVRKNFDSLMSSGNETISAVREKWGNIYPREPFPGDEQQAEVVELEEEDTFAGDVEGNTVAEDSGSVENADDKVGAEKHYSPFEIVEFNNRLEGYMEEIAGCSSIDEINKWIDDNADAVREKLEGKWLEQINQFTNRMIENLNERES